MFKRKKKEERKVWLFEAKYEEWWGDQNFYTLLDSFINKLIRYFMSKLF